MCASFRKTKDFCYLLIAQLFFFVNRRVTLYKLLKTFDKELIEWISRQSFEEEILLSKYDAIQVISGAKTVGRIFTAR